MDIFALAWIFYAMINGGLPFGLDDFESQQRFMQNTGGIPEFNSTWHSGFVEVSTAVVNIFAGQWTSPFDLDQIDSSIHTATATTAITLTTRHKEYPRSSGVLVSLHSACDGI